jgi:membrane fusion protein, epimerase transport system
VKGALHGPDSRDAAARLVRMAGWVVLGAIVPLAAWMTFAPLSMAVVAPGFVRVDLHRRPVQHREGGIVHSVAVRDGQQVRAGEPILILGDVGVDADRNRLGYRVAVEQAALVRHEAEQSRAPRLVFPADLVAAGEADERVAEALAKEANLFKARRDALNSETMLLQAQHARVREEIGALNAQIEQANSSLELQRNELHTNRKLTADGFISQTRLGQIEATVSDYASKVAERRSELARAQQRLVDTQIKMTSLQNEYVRTASDQHKATAARLGELEQEVRKTEDAVTRQVVAAPADGEIIDLRITSPGAVVRPGETVAEVVPKGAQLLVEARIRPEDVSNVHVGQAARLRLTAYRWNSAFLHGKVTYVSGDRLTDKATNAPYYGVLVLAEDAKAAEVEGMKLQAGMPAEVYLEGAKQTALAYLLEPITSTLRKAGRQL